MITAVVQHFQERVALGEPYIEALVAVSDGAETFLVPVGGIPSGSTPEEVQAHVSAQALYLWSIAPANGANVQALKDQAKVRVTSWEPSDLFTRSTLRTVFEYVSFVVHRLNEVVEQVNLATGSKIPTHTPGDWNFVVGDAKGRIDAETTAVDPPAPLGGN